MDVSWEQSGQGRAFKWNYAHKLRLEVEFPFQRISRPLLFVFAHSSQDRRKIWKSGRGESCNPRPFEGECIASFLAKMGGRGNRLPCCPPTLPVSDGSEPSLGFFALNSINHVKPDEIESLPMLPTLTYIYWSVIGPTKLIGICFLRLTYVWFSTWESIKHCIIWMCTWEGNKKQFLGPPWQTFSQKVLFCLQSYIEY